MNQILITKLITIASKKRYFKVLFIISLIALTIFIAFFIFYKLKLYNEEQISRTINNNYHVYQLFSSTIKNGTIENDSDILGSIIIPKLDINYTFFAGINEDLLKISPCRFFGDFPNKKNNLCIAGHNYLNNSFFSKINNLELNDLILIKDNNNQHFNYFVFDKFEINEDEISSIMQYPLDHYELTLLTCNNFNNKRIVIKAKN